MYALLANFAHWLQNTPMALWIAGSDWAYPPVQAIHFTGLSLWIGTTAAIDLQLMGIGRKSQTPYQLSRGLIVWNWIGLAIAVTGGFLLFSIGAGAYIANPAFQVKLGMLIPTALVVHIYVQMKAPAWSEAPRTPAIAKVIGGLELLLWFSVAGAAVSIPFF